MTEHRPISTRGIGLRWSAITQDAWEATIAALSPAERARTLTESADFCDYFTDDPSGDTRIEKAIVAIQEAKANPGAAWMRSLGGHPGHKPSGLAPASVWAVKPGPGMPCLIIAWHTDPTTAKHWMRSRRRTWNAGITGRLDG